MSICLKIEVGTWIQKKAGNVVNNVLFDALISLNGEFGNVIGFSSATWLLELWADYRNESL